MVGYFEDLCCAVFLTELIFTALLDITREEDRNSGPGHTQDQGVVVDVGALVVSSRVENTCIDTGDVQGIAFGQALYGYPLFFTSFEEGLFIGVVGMGMGPKDQGAHFQGFHHGNQSPQVIGVGVGADYIVQ